MYMYKMNYLRNHYNIFNWQTCSDLLQKAAQIRSTPFTEDSASDSSDNEDIPVALTTNSKLVPSAGGTATNTFTTEAVMTVAGPCSTKTTTCTTVRKLPVSHSSSGAMKRGRQDFSACLCKRSTSCVTERDKHYPGDQWELSLCDRLP